MLQFGCTKDAAQQEAGDKETGRIERMTDQAAEKAEEKIRTPMDKARATRELGDERLQSIDKAVKQ